MSDKKDISLLEQLIKFYRAQVEPVAIESLRLLPDSIVLGTSILAFLGMSSTYAIMVGSMIEFMVIYRIFSGAIGGISPLGAGSDALHQVCQVGFHFPNKMRLSLFEFICVPSMFPSPVMFFLSAVVSYMISAMIQFKNEINTLGGNLATRTTVGVVMGFMFLFVVLSFRYSYGCENFGSLFLSLLLGCIMGVAVLYQNIALYGRSGVNILNLPMILTTEEQGKPMYVCAPS